MKLIVGIGNPGSKYINTRHNVGFQILDIFCQKQNLNFRTTKSNFWLVESKLNAFHFFLVKPSTYVNNSGLVLKELVEHYSIKLSDILVIYDDTNLDCGILRIRKSGGDGGHNGIKSIIYHLENNNFARLRIGVGQPAPNQELADYVLSDFSKENNEQIEKEIPRIINLIEQFIYGGLSEMLNYYSKTNNIDTSN